MFRIASLALAFLSLPSTSEALFFCGFENDPLQQVCAPASNQNECESQLGEQIFPCYVSDNGQSCTSDRRNDRFCSKQLIDRCPYKFAAPLKDVECTWLEEKIDELDLTLIPTAHPTLDPTEPPTGYLMAVPTTAHPSLRPSWGPSSAPSASPTNLLTRSSSQSPSSSPTSYFPSTVPSLIISDTSYAPMSNEGTMQDEENAPESEPWEPPSPLSTSAPSRAASSTTDRDITEQNEMVVDSVGADDEAEDNPKKKKRGISIVYLLGAGFFVGGICVWVRRRRNGKDNALDRNAVVLQGEGPPAIDIDIVEPSDHAMMPPEINLVPVDPAQFQLPAEVP